VRTFFWRAVADVRRFSRFTLVLVLSPALTFFLLPLASCGRSDLKLGAK
jgi:hypothetical protein